MPILGPLLNQKFWGLDEAVCILIEAAGGAQAH